MALGGTSKLFAGELLDFYQRILELLMLKLKSLFTTSKVFLSAITAVQSCFSSSFAGSKRPGAQEINDAFELHYSVDEPEAALLISSRALRIPRLHRNFLEVRALIRNNAFPGFFVSI